MIIIIPCGKIKSITPSKAKHFYMGFHFRYSLKWARTKTDDSNIFILSAKYGILHLDQKIDPYDLKMGDPGSVSSSVIREQAIKYNLLDKNIISSAGIYYRKILNTVFKNIKYPFKGQRIGYMAQSMKKEMYE